MNVMRKKLIVLCIIYTLSLLPYNNFFMKVNNGIRHSDGGDYSIISGKVSIAVNPGVGGRITSFKYGNYEFLTGKDVNPESYGSTFWPSPQSNWNWPPPAILDNRPYSIVSSGDSIKLRSEEDSSTGFQFIKVFSAGKNNSINLKYAIINNTTKDKKAAPWEITRAHKGGLFFFPMGKGVLTKKQFDPVSTEIINGIVWYQSKRLSGKDNELTTADGSEGWFAYAIDGKLFIKKFKDIQPKTFAPGEAEISLYVSAQFDYIEIEVQGEYKNIAPKGRSTWSLKWTGTAIPSSIKVEKGNMKLVDYVRKVLKKI
jgi:hypothetical protein